MAIAVVTGGAGGIGMATCRALGKAGYTIAVIDLSGADEGTATLSAEGISAFGVTADVTDPAAIFAVAETIQSRGEVAVLVNNAGRAVAPDFASTDHDEWRRAMALNLDAAYTMARAFLPGMQQRRQGVIVNISSINGLGAYGNPAYSVAKAGMLHLTRLLAVEYGPFGIRAVSVVPGSVRTPAWDHRLANNPALFDDILKFYPLRRIAEPEDVANVVAFAVSEAARAITGSELVVDCGALAGNTLLADTITAADA